MQIQLLKNTTNTNSFKRNFVSSLDIECVLKEGSDVLSPEIILDIANPTGYNMMYIPAFKRYYFIGVENLNNTTWRIYSKGIDTLWTYKSKILALNAIIDKQEIRHNNLIDDGSYIRQVDNFVQVVNFIGGDNFDANPSYILITA